MPDSWQVLDTACAYLGLVRDEQWVWHGERGGVPVTAQYTYSSRKGGYVRFTARIDPPLGIDLQVGRLAALAVAPGTSLKNAGFRIAATDSERAREVLGDAAAAILMATECHHWVGVLDRKVSISGYSYGNSDDDVFVRDTTDKISQSLDRVAEIAGLLSQASARLGPVEQTAPAAAPRPAPSNAPGSMMGLTIALAAVGLLGMALAIGGMFSSAEAASISFPVGGGLAAIGYIAALFTWVVGMRRVRLYRKGEPALARVVAKEPMNVWENNQQLWTFTYELQDTTGRTFTSRYRAVNPPDVGEQLWVLYDRRNPKHTIPA